MIFFDSGIDFFVKWVYLTGELINKRKGSKMTIKCEKCGADVVLADDEKTGKCEKCGAEVTVKEENAAEAEKVEKKPVSAQEKVKKIGVGHNYRK